LSFTPRALWLCLLAVCTATAGELAPFREGAHLGVQVRNLQLPGSLRKDLRSGLTNRLLMRVELLVESRVAEARMVELTVKYDLWDENFHLTLDAGQGAITNRVLGSEGEVIAALNDLRLPELFELAGLSRAQEHMLKGEALLNPIEKERLASIRKWVAENSTQTPRDADASPRSTAAPRRETAEPSPGQSSAARPPARTRPSTAAPRPQ